MSNKNSNNINIGDWYSMCCILCLHQIDDNDQLLYLKDLLDDEDDD